MCVVSMVMDGKWDEWNRRYHGPYQVPPLIPSTPVPLPTQQEVDEFRRLLERAREYDREHNEPDCELQEKKDRLRKMAEELGVKIDFV